MKTSNEIYEQMCASVKEKTGYAVREGGDMSVRLLAFAAQLESLYAYGDWVKNQCFPQTAEGEYLDRHAEVRGIVRVPAVSAEGIIRFKIPSAAGTDVEIPAGVICRTADGRGFVTTVGCTVLAGETYADAAAKALEGGTDGNVQAGTVTFMTSPPIGVSSCTNPSQFYGGVDAEGDDSLRERVAHSYAKLPNGANAAYYEKEAKSIAGVKSVLVLPKKRGLGTVDIVITSPDGMPDGELIEKVKAHIDERREMCVDTLICAPTSTIVDVSVAVETEEGYAFEDVSALVEAAIRGYFDGSLLGKDILRVKLGDIVYSIDGVRNYSITLPEADIAAKDGELPVLGSVTVEEWS